MFLKFGNLPDDEASKSFEALEDLCQSCLRRWVDTVGKKPEEMHDYAVTISMQLAYEAGVVAAVWGMHRDTLEAALKVGIAAYDKAIKLQEVDG